MFGSDLLVHTLFVSLLLFTYGPIDATLAMLLVHPLPAPEHVFDSVLVCENVATTLSVSSAATVTWFAPSLRQGTDVSQVLSWLLVWLVVKSTEARSAVEIVLTLTPTLSQEVVTAHEFPKFPKFPWSLI